ncbi:MAG: DUF3050 domain-containing protein [Gallionella sp.]|nr:DUF3050 domain-containing protein [Gallionella sp.]
MEISELRGIPELKARLDSHPLYTSVRTLAELRCFMEHHVFPVWDFMSLLKYLQGEIAPAGAPWMPASKPETALLQRFVNEIVLAEESDEGLPDADGNPTFVSHFALYLGAMEEVGADTRPVRAFIKAVKKHGIAAALKRDDIPEPARRFMKTTFGFLATDKPHVVAAAFALGREQVIPGMFRALLADIGIGKKKAPLFHYYLERHIHLDDEFHGPLSLKLLEQLCSDSDKKLRSAEKTARLAIEARIALWDGVHAALPTQSKKRSK